MPVVGGVEARAEGRSVVVRWTPLAGDARRGVARLKVLVDPAPAGEGPGREAWSSGVAVEVGASECDIAGLPGGRPTRFRVVAEAVDGRRGDASGASEAVSVLEPPAPAKHLRLVGGRKEVHVSWQVEADEVISDDEDGLARLPRRATATGFVVQAFLASRHASDVSGGAGLDTLKHSSALASSEVGADARKTTLNGLPSGGTPIRVLVQAVGAHGAGLSEPVFSDVRVMSRHVAKGTLMKKQGSMFPTWKTRFIRVDVSAKTSSGESGALLEYFDNDPTAGAERKGFMWLAPLPECTCEPVKGTKSNEFEIVAKEPSRTLRVRADTKEVMREWCEELSMLFASAV